MGQARELELTPEQVGQVLKDQVSKSIINARSRIYAQDASVTQIMFTLEQEVHRILDGEMIYPLT